jgi:predicted esterase
MRTVFLLLSALAVSARADDDLASVPSEDLRAGKDENKRYFLIGPAKESKAPKAGFGLVIVLPGGPGTADFHPFVKRLWKNALPEGYLVAQPVAVKWRKDQEIVWPTDGNKVPGMKFTTEEFVAAVLDEVGKKHKLNPDRIFTLSWSSSGPVAYAVALSNSKVKGSFIAMSVYKPDLLPPLKKAKGHAFYLYHSPDDRVCPIAMARKAVKELKAEGATVELTEYKGGHGWRGPVFDDVKMGVEWLQKSAAK